MNFRFERKNMEVKYTSRSHHASFHLNSLTQPNYSFGAWSSWANSSLVVNMTAIWCSKGPSFPFPPPEYCWFQNFWIPCSNNLRLFPVHKHPWYHSLIVLISWRLRLFQSTAYPSPFLSRISGLVGHFSPLQSVSLLLLRENTEKYTVDSIPSFPTSRHMQSQTSI